MIYSGHSSRLYLATKALPQVASPLHWICKTTRLPAHAAQREEPVLGTSVRNVTVRKAQRWVLFYGKGTGKREWGASRAHWRHHWDVFWSWWKSFWCRCPSHPFFAKGMGDLSSSTTACPIETHRSLTCVRSGHHRAEGGWACFRRRGNSLCEVEI